MHEQEGHLDILWRLLCSQLSHNIFWKIVEMKQAWSNRVHPFQAILLKRNFCSSYVEDTVEVPCHSWAMHSKSMDYILIKQIKAELHGKHND